MQFLVGTHAYNNQIQNTAVALYEANMLGAAYLGFVDNYRGAAVKQLRRLVADSLPKVDRQLKRRRIVDLPDSFIYKYWRWELFRTVGVRSVLSESVADRVWEWGEYALDRRCARALENGPFDAYLGVEHGALFSIQKARQLGKKSVVAFLSPHRTMRQRWVEPEYEKYPELENGSSQKLRQLSIQRDERRDEEARLADIVFANSSLTRDSLIAHGVSPDKILTVPLGFAEPKRPVTLPTSISRPLKFIYAGAVSVHKGSHYLLKAWLPFRDSQVAELHIYGTKLLPERVLNDVGSNVFFHGPVTSEELFAAFESGAAFIFPSLCDGFGLVVTESLAHGLPVISTHNAGASDCIRNGENGFLIPAANAEAITERIEWCIRNADQLLGMRMNAIKSASQFSWARFRESFRTGLRNKLGIVPEAPSREMVLSN